MANDTIQRVRTPAADERRFIEEALVAVGAPAGDAGLVAEILLASDLRGIESHGIARLRWFHVDRLRRGTIEAHPRATVLRETPTSLAIDAGNGLGHPASHRAMTRTIAKARESGVCFTTVRNSNHYGIAGYYAMMALPHDMIGISSTDSIHFAVPTFGRDKLLGTNPFAYAIPAGNEPPFVLDFATTTVTYGKLEVYERMGKPLEPGWAVDAEGATTTDATLARHSGALLPLGGYGTDGGGHKGYGLGVLSEILCGVLAGGAFGRGLSLIEGPEHVGGHTGHFFGAIRIDTLRDVAEFKADMDAELRTFKSSRPAAGHDRVYVSGEIEHEHEIENAAQGVPHLPKVWDDVDALAAELGIRPMQRL
jgi:LDH2 family malate/lactate/ureidoglycolate dehydrogenase